MGRSTALTCAVFVLARAYTAQAGINVWTSHGPPGGVVTAGVATVAIDPITPTTLYAGTPDYGVLKSTDAGGTWAKTGLTAAVGVLAIDPVTPSTLYAVADRSVFKSTDAGANWDATGLTSTSSVGVLAIDPVTPSTLYAVADGSVLKSTDAGVNWGATGLTSTSSVGVLAIDPVTPNTLYAGTYGNGVFKSTDAGGTWTAAKNGLTSTHVYALAIDPLTPTTLYATTTSYPTAANEALIHGGCCGRPPRSPLPTPLPPISNVFKSTDAGGTWTAADMGLHVIGGLSLAIDPIMPTTLYGGTLGGVLKSTDAGGTWSAANAGLTATRILALAIAPLTPTTLYAVTDRGVDKSTDAGGKWTAVNVDLPVNSAVTALAIAPLTPKTLYAMTSSRGVGKSTDAGGTWNLSNANPPSDVDVPVFAFAVDPLTPSTLYAVNYSGVLKSTDAGGTWNVFNTGLPVNSTVSGLAIDPLTPSTLYTWIDSSVFKSTNAGGTWNVSNAGLPVDSPVSALAIDPVTPSTLYAYTETYRGRVFKSTDAGGSWTAVSVELPVNSAVVALDIEPNTNGTLTPTPTPTPPPTSTLAMSTPSPTSTPNIVVAFAIDPVTPSTLYAGTYRGVFKSTDAGSTWNVSNTGLPVDIVSELAIDPLTPSTLYARTFSSVFKSTNAGGTWAALNAGLTSTHVSALAIDPGTPSTLYAGTDGGVFDIEQVPASCAGDCNDDQAVGIDELLTLVNIALGEAQASMCQQGMPSGARIDIALIIQAVHNALTGCSSTPSTATPTPIDTPTATISARTRTPTPTATHTPLSGNFVDNGDGTITDTRTGLMWEKKDQSGGLHDVNAQYVWEGVCNDNTPPTPPPTVPPGASKNQASASVGEACQPDAAAAATCSAATHSTVGCAQCSGSLTCEGEAGLTTIWHWLAQLNAAHFAGHSDWRIPTADELKTILDGSAPGCISGAPCVPPALDTACTAGCTAASCSCTQALYYWSATTTTEADFPGPGYAWIVSFMLGTWDPEPKCGGTYVPLIPYVRAVRGTAIPTPTATPTETPVPGNFIDNGDGTITDTQRGLMWEKKDASGGLHDGNAGHAWACLSPDAEFFCQPDAAAAATCSAATGGADGCGQCPRGVPCNREGLTTIWEWLNQLNAAHFAGYSDWRIPTVGDEGGAAELETIVDAGAPRCGARSGLGACVPAQFDTACMPGCSVAGCSCANGDTWSSISVPENPWAWEVLFHGGPLDAEGKDSNRFVRAVRGAPSPATTATPIPTPIPGNFVDNGDGTITDTQRGLTWEKKGVSYNDWGSTGGGPGSHDARARYVWAGWCNDNSGYCQPDAAAASTCAAATGGAVGCALCGGVATCNTHNGATLTLWQWLNQLNAASFAGHSDWRLPTVSELETIVDATGPACGSGTACVPLEFGGGGVCEGECSVTNTAGCSCTQAGLSWSATSFASQSTSAWLVNFGTGGADFLDKTLNYYVRAVRGD